MGAIVSRLQPSGSAEIACLTSFLGKGSLGSVIVAATPQGLDEDPGSSEEGITGDGSCRRGEFVVFFAAHPRSEGVDLGSGLRPIYYSLDRGQRILSGDYRFV